MQKWTKNHPLAPVQIQIGPNLLKNQPPQKDRKFLSSWPGRSGRYKWLRCENDLMFCDTCLTAKACSNPFTEGFTTFQNSTLIKKDGTPIIIKVESQGPPHIQLGVKPWIIYPPVQIIPGVVDQRWIGTSEAGQGV